MLLFKTAGQTVPFWASTVLMVLTVWLVVAAVRSGRDWVDQAAATQ